MSTDTIEVAELLADLDTGRPLVLLDVRNRDEAARWRLEARRPVETLNVPYFEFLEDPAPALAQMPRDRRVIAVVCAKGDSSEYVAGLLRQEGLEARSVVGGMLAYGEHLEPVAVPLTVEENGRFEIWQLNRRGKGCLSYLVRSGAEAVLFDPSRRLEAYRAFADRLGVRIVRVLDTHVHADHVSGGPGLARSMGVPYFVAAGDGVELSQPVTPLGDGEILRLGDGVTIETRIIATPGHTPGSTSYLIGARYLLSGDTLFVSGVGRPDLGGHVVAWGKALFHTLRERIAALPGATVILPAHYASVADIGADGVVSARLDQLRRASPELAIADEAQLVVGLRASVREPPAAYEDIVRVNLGQLELDEARASEWELGANECAASVQSRSRQS